MSTDEILRNSKIYKPLICGLCKSELDKQAPPVSIKCEHVELGSTNERYYEVLNKNFKITLGLSFYDSIEY